MGLDDEITCISKGLHDSFDTLTAQNTDEALEDFLTRVGEIIKMQDPSFKQVLLKRNEKGPRIDDDCYM